MRLMHVESSNVIRAENLLNTWPGIFRLNIPFMGQAFLTTYGDRLADWKNGVKLLLNFGRLYERSIRAVLRT